jgi:hypothetical protein
MKHRERQRERERWGFEGIDCIELKRRRRW